MRPARARRSRTRPAPIEPSTVALVHPSSWALTIPKTTPSSPELASATPGRSIVPAPAPGPRASSARGRHPLAESDPLHRRPDHEGKDAEVEEDGAGRRNFPEDRQVEVAEISRQEGPPESQRGERRAAREQQPRPHPAQRMDAQLSQGLVVPAGGSVSTGGRPPLGRGLGGGRSGASKAHN